MDPVLCTRGALAAVAMAFAGAAFAGGPGINLPAPALQEGFSIHGLIDTGFQIHHANGTTSARMMPNGDEASAFHLRARENLHGGNYVRLKLSAPFKPDSGEFNNKNTSGDPILFNEAFVAVGGEWGELAAGRLANIFSGNERRPHADLLLGLLLQQFGHLQLAPRQRLPRRRHVFERP